MEVAKNVHSKIFTLALVASGPEEKGDEVVHHLLMLGRSVVHEVQDEIRVAHALHQMQLDIVSALLERLGILHARAARHRTVNSA